MEYLVWIKNNSKTNFFISGTSSRWVTWADRHIKKRIKPAEADTSSAISVNKVSAKPTPVTW